MHLLAWQPGAASGSGRANQTLPARPGALGIEASSPVATKVAVEGPAHGPAAPDSRLMTVANRTFVPVCIEKLLMLRQRMLCLRRPGRAPPQDWQAARKYATDAADSRDRGQLGCSGTRPARQV